MRSSRRRGGARRCWRACAECTRRRGVAVTFPTDLEIARKAKLLPMPEIAERMGIGPHLLEPYGHDVAKIKLEAIEELAGRPKAKYVVGSAITPTPLGEGKTTTTVGLGQALTHIGHSATVAIRQPSMGPTFGIKGGAAGGGYSQVVPMERLNLHLTGDMHAITAAHNLLAAMIDNQIHHHETLVDRDSVTWRRVLDVSDRVLRNVIVGLGTREDGVIRQTGFDITAASEVMTVLALTTSLKDMRQRLGRIVIGNTTSGKPISAEELHAAGAMTVILRDAIKPNLLQTLENTPVLVHAGPFGNIATGNSSVIADLIGIHTGEFLVTEAGFGADMGAERGRGATDLAEAVAEAAEEPSSFQFLYPSSATLREKIETIATKVYGASAVEYYPPAAEQLDSYERNGFGNLSVCIAKTHLSISSDPKLKGAPKGWKLPVREVRASEGAGFVYPICGDMRTRPGLPSSPNAVRSDIDDKGESIGLS